MKLIGKGSFSEVYKFNSEKVVIKTIDPIKEAMAVGFFPNSKLFPKIDFFDHMDYGDDFKYIMKYDEDLKSKSVISKLKPYYQNMYRQLREIQGIFRNLNDYEYKISSLKGVRKYHKDALIKAYWAIMNYLDERDIAFEISPRNVSTKNGRLILNDCFFSVSLLNKTN